MRTVIKSEFRTRAANDARISLPVDLVALTTCSLQIRVNLMKRRKILASTSRPVSLSERIWTKSNVAVVGVAHPTGADDVGRSGENQDDDDDSVLPPLVHVGTQDMFGNMSDLNMCRNAA